jgi:hypothetical protein
MKKLLLFGAVLAFATAGMAAMKEVNGHWVHEYPTKSHAAGTGASATSANITYHGGDVLYQAKVVPIYWGTYWGGGTGANEAATMTAFYAQFGTNSHYGIITQYSDTAHGAIQLSTLTATNGGYFDNTNPSAKKVTDAMVQAEVKKYLTTHTFNDETIYEVFIGPAFYSNDGSSDSCGGHHLAYCAYHGSFSSGGNTVKYSIEPYPSCSGCHASGFSTVQDAQHFACHETREAVTDPVNAWWDGTTGYEADDKCAWTPAPFISGGYGYQDEWSNNANGAGKVGKCIQ